MNNLPTDTCPQLDADTKERAEQVLAGLGLSLEEVVTVLMRRVAREGALPFDIKEPNDETLAAIEALEAGGAPGFKDVDSLMDDLLR